MAQQVSATGIGEWGMTNDRDGALRDRWHCGVSEVEPEVVCVHGSYINSAVLSRLSGCSDGLQTSDWSDSHGDNRGPSHHNHSSGPKVHLEPFAVDSIDGITDDRICVLRRGLKIREEGHGFLLALGFNGFIINKIGSQLLELCANGSATLGTLKAKCQDLGVSEASGLAFFRRLAAFGLISFQ